MGINKVLKIPSHTIIGEALEWEGKWEGLLSWWALLHHHHLHDPRTPPSPLCRDAANLLSLLHHSKVANRRWFSSRRGFLGSLKDMWPEQDRCQALYPLCAPAGTCLHIHIPGKSGGGGEISFASGFLGKFFSALWTDKALSQIHHKLQKKE